MEYKTANKTRPFSLRLTEEERARLEQQAAGVSLGAYIRSRLFDGHIASPRRTRGKFPVKDQKALAQLLGKLGQSRLANNLNQLARLANSGALPVTPETEQSLHRAALDIANMKRLLMKALSVAED